MNDDIKHALGSAFTDEPPLRVHRDEVLREGRTRLRQRRLAITGGFAAVLAVVVFSASLVAGANSAQVEPAGTGFGGSPTGCETSTPPSATAPPKSCEPMSEAHAQALTTVLGEGDVVPAEFTLRGSRHYPDPLVFVQERAAYVASADLVAADGQEGTVYVMVGGKTSNSARVDCKPPVTCEFRTVDGEDVQIGTLVYESTGEVQTMAHLERADGTQVYASTSNISTRTLDLNGKVATNRPTIDRQPLTVDQLVKIVTLPGLEF